MPRAMVLDVDPVAHVAAVAVDGQPLAAHAGLVIIIEDELFPGNWRGP